MFCLQACRVEGIESISEKLKHKMSVQSPPKILVEKYLIEIAKNYNVPYEPDPQVTKISFFKFFFFLMVILSWLLHTFYVMYR